jgi:hypothetical protein
LFSLKIFRERGAEFGLPLQMLISARFLWFQIFQVFYGYALIRVLFLVALSDYMGLLPLYWSLNNGMSGFLLSRHITNENVISNF